MVPPWNSKSLGRRGVLGLQADVIGRQQDLCPIQEALTWYLALPSSQRSPP
jgi:hypothetical protein